MTDLYDNPELAARDQGMAIAAATNSNLLDWLRNQMRLLYAWRKSCRPDDPRVCVSGDDARVAVELAFAIGQFERPASMNFLGSVFRDGWEPTGERIKSKTSGSHGNDLPCWRRVGQ
jgi:hypothetical protein